MIPDLLGEAFERTDWKMVETNIPEQEQARNSDEVLVAHPNDDVLSGRIAP